jgi:hypothetical protein
MTSPPGPIADTQGRRAPGPAPVTCAVNVQLACRRGQRPQRRRGDSFPYAAANATATPTAALSLPEAPFHMSFRA